MSDMSQAIIPKSDQLNSDDLIAGPMTITITEIKIKGGQEQPVAIHFIGDNGKPYKPCKSMSRVLVQLWGPDANKYVGRSMTLYRDPSVKWAGMEVGGIRISHMSDIEGQMTMALTATRGSRKPFTVTPLISQQEAQDWTPVINACLDLAALQALWKKLSADEKLQYGDVKDAKKAALSAPAADPHSDFRAELSGEQP